MHTHFSVFAVNVTSAFNKKPVDCLLYWSEVHENWMILSKRGLGANMVFDNDWNRIDIINQVH
jgi:hypothetical protein